VLFVEAKNPHSWGGTFADIPTLSVSQTSVIFIHNLIRLQWSTSVSLSNSVVADLMAAVTMAWCLHKNRTGISRCVFTPESLQTSVLNKRFVEPTT
jgi:hypothetical protein